MCLVPIQKLTCFANRTTFGGNYSVFRQQPPKMNASDSLADLTPAQQQILNAALDVIAKCNYCPKNVIPALNGICEALDWNYKLTTICKMSTHCNYRKEKLDHCAKEKARLMEFDDVFSELHVRGVCEDCKTGITDSAKHWANIKAWM